jgi:hypothetical protein
MWLSHERFRGQKRLDITLLFYEHETVQYCTFRCVPSHNKFWEELKAPALLSNLYDESNNYKLMFLIFSDPVLYITFISADYNYLKKFAKYNLNVANRRPVFDCKHKCFMHVLSPGISLVTSMKRPHVWKGDTVIISACSVWTLYVMKWQKWVRHRFLC